MDCGCVCTGVVEGRAVFELCDAHRDGFGTQAQAQEHTKRLMQEFIEREGLIDISDEYE